MLALLPILAALPTTIYAATSLTLGSPSYTAAGTFPTSAFHSYYNDPTATSAQPQPIITNPISGYVFPPNLTDPNTIPLNNTIDPHPLPPTPLDPSQAGPLLWSAYTQILSIASSANEGAWGNSTCARCMAGLEVAKALALTSAAEVPLLAVALCSHFKFSSTCGNTYSVLGLGSVITQVLAAADVGGYDGQMICNNFINTYCPLPPTSPLNMTGYFAKPKPSPALAPTPSGERVKVLHMSDFHLDPRYATGSEANCTSGLCCRSNNVNTLSPQAPLLPASRYGAYDCDTPYSLGLAALSAVPVLTGTQDTGFAWGVYTGDLVSHDPDNQLSRSYIEYAEVALYTLYRTLLNSGPIYVALGNHDSYNQAQDAPHAISSLGTNLSSQFSWNYDNVASLWEYDGWIEKEQEMVARTHYGAYSVKRPDGLRVITMNTDLWYKANYFNYINMTLSDPSGMLRFIADELQAAEDAGERAWIVGHVLSGWDGTNPLDNPTNLFYQIIDRYSPHVVAAIFFGHTHEDQFSIFYANNGTNASAATAGAVSWIAPSITPLTGLNSGFRMYEVDAKTFDIMDAHTWYANVSSFPTLDNQTSVGPVYGYEYNTRSTYGANISWPTTAPLNATWWHLVTEQMEAQHSLVETFTLNQGKHSILTTNCTSEACVNARICYMRSGSASLAKQNCVTGYGSVQT